MSSKKNRTDMIWMAAAEYEKQFITGCPISVFTVGTYNRLTKCLAVFNWAKSIWSACLQRQDAINALPPDNDDEINDADLNYLFAGPIPYAINELFAEVNAVPTITSISPTNGAAGTTVTINGTNFVNVSAVTFNGVNATSFNVVNQNQITAVCPTGFIAGPLSVTTPIEMVVSKQVYVRQ
jgi:hypothetical protein